MEALGLGPLWRIRDRGDAADAGADDGADDVADDELRRSDIPTLGWLPLQEVVATCIACDLARSRTQTVFGTGPARAEWLVVGSGPNADEDACGEAFVGDAGRLLDAMLASLGLSRSRDVFVTNLVKCRPPGDRAPNAIELARCRPYLERQVALLEPRLILVVGESAATALLGPTPDPTALRGRQHRLSIGGRTVRMVVTQHPGALLRSPAGKAETWADLCLARQCYEEAIAAAS